MVGRLCCAIGRLELGEHMWSLLFRHSRGLHILEPLSKDRSEYWKVLLLKPNEPDLLVLVLRMCWQGLLVSQASDSVVVQVEVLGCCLVEEVWRDGLEHPHVLAPVKKGACFERLYFWQDLY